MVMLAILNAHERTEEQFRELFAAASDGFVFKVCLPFPILNTLEKGRCEWREKWRVC